MRRTIGVLVLLLGLSMADEVLFKGAKVKSVAKSSDLKTAESKKDQVVSAKSQPQAQERQDTYGAPQAPSVDTYGSPQAPAQDSYGSPQAPVQDSYGSPQADPVGAAPVQGEVGTQGYYYYYYPVANNYGGPTQNYQSHGSSASTSSKGGLLSGGNLGILIFLGLGILVVIALVASFASNNNRRSFSLLDSLDTDEVMYQVYRAIDLWNELSA
jgi:hypothetical protein